MFKSRFVMGNLSYKKECIQATCSLMIDKELIHLRWSLFQINKYRLRKLSVLYRRNYKLYIHMQTKSPPNFSALASSSMWTFYSMINAIIKSKYGVNLKSYPRVTTLLKSFDTDIKQKAAVFSQEDIYAVISSMELMTPYWLVRKVQVFI